MNETRNPNPDDPTMDATHSLSGAFMPPQSPLPGLPLSEIALSEGTQTVIGRFRLLEKIGEGGFGVVYVAEQKTPVKRRVALKIIKLGMDTRAVVARFEAERQALAMMDHPNIAKVFDAGATDTGRPYFVMELVRGIPITEYCDQNNLPPAQRLALFIDVCHAIQHAHQKGVIHRDIKPSNILVTSHDGTPIPKVIDFGIAKATQGDLTDKTIYTQFQQFIGTPAYMSPEQAEMSAMDVDTRSDIYSLGVLLYELLTGTTPFDGKELLKAGMDEMRRRIRETEPIRPSNRLSGMTNADSTGTARHRGMDAPRLITLLRGDLDWVVMKCLEKDRTRRYETANGVAMDIQRHLNNEPITARPPSTAYRLQKTFRRNKVAFAAGLAVAATLLLGIVVSTWQAVLATRAQREAVAAQASESIQRQKAQANEQQALEARANEAHLRKQAQAAELTARQRAYASDMNVAKQQLDGNNLGRALDLLKRQQPETGQQDLRGWEWRYLWQQTRSDASFTLCQQPAEINALAVSPDGVLLAIGSFHKGLSLWDLRTRQEICRLAEGESKVRAAFSPTEPLVAFASSGDQRITLRLWNTATRQNVAEIPLEGEFCLGLAFARDGRTLATATSDGCVTVWRIPEGTRVANYMAKDAGDAASFTGNFTTTFAASADLGFAAHALPNNSIRVLDLRSGRELWRTAAAKDYVTALAFSPDGKSLATAVHDTPDIRLWDVATGKPVGRLAGHTSWVSSMVFSPDGKKLTSSSGDQTIRVWDVPGGKCLDVLRGHRQEVWRLALLPDDKTLVSGCKDGTVCFWDTSVTHPHEARMTLPVENVDNWSFSADGQSIVTVARQGQVMQWSGADFLRQSPVAVLGTNIYSSCFSDDGRFLALAGTNGLIQVWNPSQRLLLHQWTNKTGNMTVEGLSADGKKLIASADRDNLLQEWDVTTGTEIQSWRGALGERASTLTPGERSHLALGWGGDIVLRNLDDASQTKPNLEVLEPYNAFFSPDGKLLAVTSSLGYAKVWEAATWKPLATLGGFLNGVKSSSFSRDGKRLAVASNGKEAVRLYDTESWQDVLTLESMGTGSGGAAFSPDGNTLIWGNITTLYLWRAPTWDQITAAEAKQNAARH